MNLHGLLCYCRQGFEPELAAELGERAAAAGIAGYARANRDDGHVLFVTGDQADAQALARALPLRDLVFARQKLRLFAELRALDPGDRLTPLLAALPADWIGELERRGIAVTRDVLRQDAREVLRAYGHGGGERY